MLNNTPNKIKKIPSNQEKFMHYKFLLDKTYNKLNKFVLSEFDETNSNINSNTKIKSNNEKSKTNKLKYLTSKIENLLLLTNEYKILIELENEKNSLSI